jgi:hypothetical protein
MTDQNLNDELASEAEEGFGGGTEYEKRVNREPTPGLPVYRVWNKNPNKPDEPATPGIAMITREGDKKLVEIVPTIKAVILYAHNARRFATGSGKTFRVSCESHGMVKEIGETKAIVPSVKVDAPLCRNANVKDLVQIMSKWKNMDQAKIDAKIKEVTDESGELMVCGLKTAQGMIALCPFARRNETKDKTGKVLKSSKPDCEEYIYVQAYDIERKREFKMELVGKAIWNGEFVAPFHQFFKFLRTAGGVKDGNPVGHSCFSYSVVLSPATDGKSFYLNVTDHKAIAQAENRATMKDLAVKAKDKYARGASRLSKAAYMASKQIKEVEKAQNSAPVQNVPTPVTPPVVAAPVQPTPVAEAAPARSQSQPVSFDEDDIPF